MSRLHRVLPIQRKSMLSVTVRWIFFSSENQKGGTAEYTSSLNLEAEFFYTKI